jgi:putative heme-binding domain-containing protein
LVPKTDGVTKWAATAAIPLVRRNIARKTVADDLGRLNSLLALFEGPEPPAPDVARDVLGGIDEALKGRRSVPRPDLWAKVAPRFVRPDVRDLALKLGLVFGDKGARDELRARLNDPKAPADARRKAIAALAEAKVPGLVPDLIARLDEAETRGAALRGLAFYGDKTVPEVVLKNYESFTDTERDDAVLTLASRPEWALALLEAVGRKVVPRRDVSVTVARQLQALRRPEVDEALAKHWGTIRPTSGDKAALVGRYKAMLTPDSLRAADPARGRQVFQRTCQQCHKLYGEGGEVGPELTGSDRANLDYVLQNVLDPSASVASEYQVTNVATADGRLVSGLLREQTPAALVLQTVNGRVVVPRSEVEEVRSTPSSMMPEGLFDKLTEAEVRDLVAYLAARSQVPLPPAGGR